METSPLKRQVIVLGAGASVDLKLPMGSQLTGQIRDALNFKQDEWNATGGNSTLRTALFQSSRECPHWFAASQMIFSSMPLAPSIDNFVDVHRHDPGVAFCAKAAITQCILDAERSSTIYVRDNNTYNTIDFQKNISAWHTLFFRNLTVNCTFDDLAERLASIGIISFNYDRCFEHFLFHAIKTYYRVSDNDVAELFRVLEIYHPYGKVGDLPTLSIGPAVRYGEEVNPSRLLEISRQIKTFTESTEGSSDIERIR